MQSKPNSTQIWNFIFLIKKISPHFGILVFQIINLVFHFILFFMFDFFSFKSSWSMPIQYMCNLKQSSTQIWNLIKKKKNLHFIIIVFKIISPCLHNICAIKNKIQPKSFFFWLYDYDYFSFGILFIKSLWSMVI